MFFVHVFAINNQDELHYFFYQNSHNHHEGGISIKLGKIIQGTYFGQTYCMVTLDVLCKNKTEYILSNDPLSLAMKNTVSLI
jgi:hypothetical protein